MTWRSILLVLNSTLVSALLFGCGGGGGGSSSGGPTGDTAAMMKTREAAALAISNYYNTLSHQDPAAENQALVQFLKGRPEFEAAGQEEPYSVWARYKDTGEILVIVNDGSLSQAELDGTRAASRVSVLAAGRAATELPWGDNVVLADCLGATGYPDPSTPGDWWDLSNAAVRGRYTAAANNMALGALALKNVGYIWDTLRQVGYSPSIVLGTPFILQTAVKNADAFYMFGHGGLGVDRSGKQVYILNTSLPVFSDFNFLTLNTFDIDNANNLKAEVAAGRVSSMMYVDGVDGAVAPPGTTGGKKYKLVMRTYYAITPAFVQNYMSFNPQRSFVFINGCNGADPTLASPMMDAFKAVKAAVYASWDKHSDGFDIIDTGELVMATLCGVNSISISIEPPSRPFDWQSMLAGLQHLTRRNTDYTFAQTLGQQGLGNLTIKQFSSSPQSQFGMFAPSVTRVLIDSSHQTITASGQFGSDLNEVGATLSGQTLNVQSTSATQIVCALPDKFVPGPFVVSIKGHPSNAVPLMSWTLPMHLTMHYGNATFTAEMSLHLAGDIYTARQAAFGIVYTSGAQPNSVVGGLAILPDSKLLSATASGSYKDNLNNTISWSLTNPVSATTILLNSAYNTSDNLPSTLSLLAESSGVDVYGDANGIPVGRFLMLALAGKNAITETRQNGGQPITSPLTVAEVVEPAGIPMDTAFTILPGFVSNGPTPIANSPDFYTTRWSWDTASPTPAFDANTTRAARVPARPRQ